MGHPEHSCKALRSHHINHKTAILKALRINMQKKKKKKKKFEITIQEGKSIENFP
jgi:hypothetical protein